MSTSATPVRARLQVCQSFRPSWTTLATRSEGQYSKFRRPRKEKYSEARVRCAFGRDCKVGFAICVSIVLFTAAGMSTSGAVGGMWWVSV